MLHHLSGAGKDRDDPGVTGETTDRILFHETVTTVQLYALVRHPVGHLWNPGLGHGHLERDILLP